MSSYKMSRDVISSHNKINIPHLGRHIGGSSLLSIVPVVSPRFTSRCKYSHMTDLCLKYITPT